MLADGGSESIWINLCNFLRTLLQYQQGKWEMHLFAPTLFIAITLRAVKGDHLFENIGKVVDLIPKL
jgi:hypothetical protein